MILDQRPNAVGATVARRRFPATPWGCVRAALHSGRLVASCGVLLSLAMMTVVARWAPGLSLAVGLAPAGVTVASLITVAAHEVCHLSAVRALGGRANYTAAGVNQLGVIHDVHDPVSYTHLDVYKRQPGW